MYMLLTVYGEGPLIFPSYSSLSKMVMKTFTRNH